MRPCNLALRFKPSYLDDQRKYHPGKLATIAKAKGGHAKLARHASHGTCQTCQQTPWCECPKTTKGQPEDLKPWGTRLTLQWACQDLRSGAEPLVLALRWNDAPYLQEDSIQRFSSAAGYGTIHETLGFTPSPKSDRLAENQKTHKKRPTCLVRIGIAFLTCRAHKRRGEVSVSTIQVRAQVPTRGGGGGGR